MQRIVLHDKARIEAVLRRDPWLRIYELGDLDEAYFRHAAWFGLEDDGHILELLLLYTGLDLPTLLALTDAGTAAGEPMADLVQSVLPLLPPRFYAHLSGNLSSLLGESHDVKTHGIHLKMALTDPSRLDEVDLSGTAPLHSEDAPELEEFYRESYPGNWFDRRMLESGQYYGIREKDLLVSVAGVHVYSPEYKVAALGNIATRPEARGRGLARAVTARLCRELLRRVDRIGLNVRADNAAAIACYEKLGFRPRAEYEECQCEGRLGIARRPAPC